MRSEQGFANIVFAIFMMAAIFLTFQGFVDYRQVQLERRQLTQALKMTLESATVQGTSNTQAGAVVWNSVKAQKAADQALETTLNVQLVSQSYVGVHGGSATFNPVGSAPANWTGSLQLSNFQTSDTAGTAYIYNTTQSMGGPFVAADLSVPVRERFFGIPLRFTLQVGRTFQIYGYNGKEFQQYQ